jgi:hypothetical protein
MNVDEMLPDEASNAEVVGDGLVGTVGTLIAQSGTFDWNIISEGLGQVRDFGTEDMGDISLEYGGGISPAHRKDSESERSKRGVERGHVARSRMKLSLIKGDIKIKGGVDRTTSEVFRDHVGVRRHSSVLDSNSVERFERMHETKRLSILLVDTEPATVIRRRRRLIDTRTPLVFDDLSDFVEDTARNRTLSEYPRDMRDMRNLDRREVLRIESSSFVVSPSKGSVVLAENPLD